MQHLDVIALLLIGMGMVGIGGAMVVSALDKLIGNAAARHVSKRPDWNATYQRRW